MDCPTTPDGRLWGPRRRSSSHWPCSPWSLQVPGFTMKVGWNMMKTNKFASEVKNHLHLEIASSPKNCFISIFQSIAVVFCHQTCTAFGHLWGLLAALQKGTLVVELAQDRQRLIQLYLVTAESYQLQTKQTSTPPWASPGSGVVPQWPSGIPRSPNQNAISFG